MSALTFDHAGGQSQNVTGSSGGASLRDRVDPFAVELDSDGAVTIAFNRTPLLTCDEEFALELNALLNVGYWIGKG
jgi:hypothetical protein